MSLHDLNTSRQLLRHFFSQENAKKHHHRLEKTPRGAPVLQVLKPALSAELQQIKKEYEVLKRKNQEEMEFIRKIENTSSFPPDLGLFLGNTTKNFQILINNEFSGSVEATPPPHSVEAYRWEAEKLSEQNMKLKTERDELKKKLQENHEKIEAQNLFLQEIQQNHEKLNSKFTETNTEIEKEIRGFVIEAENEKKRYLGSLKKLIEIFQIEKLRIEDTFSSLNSEVITEKSQHFQDIQSMKQIIEDLKEEIDKNQIFFFNNKLNISDKRSFQVFQEIDEYRKYSHELEMIIRNLGDDIQTLEKENVDLKELYEAKFQALQTEDGQRIRELCEEVELCKEKFRKFDEVKSENQYILEENEALKINLKNMEEKYLWRIQKMNKDFKDKTLMMSTQIEDQTQTIDKLKMEQTALQSTVNNLQNELKQKTTKKQNLEATHQDLEIQNKLYKTEIEKVQESYEHKIKQHKEQINKLLNLHESETKNFKLEISRLEKERRDYQTGMIEQETLYKILKVDFDEFICERNNLLGKFAQEKEIMNEEFKKKVEGFNEQIKELQSTIVGYEEVELTLHKQIQQLVHNINELSAENKNEIDSVRKEVIKQIGQELEGLRSRNKVLEEQILKLEKENVGLKSDLDFKQQKLSSVETDLHNLKTSLKDTNQVLEDSKEHYEGEILQLKLTNERNAKRSKDEIERLSQEFEQQSLFCDHLDKRKKELERLNTKFSDNLEQMTKVYEREISDLKLDLTNTKTFYENKMNYARNEADFEAKKYENRINELEQELKMLKFEMQWLQDAQNNKE